MADDPITIFAETGLALTARLYDSTGLVTSSAMTESPASSGRYKVTAATLAAVPLAAGSYGYKIVDGSEVLYGTGRLERWSGTAEILFASEAEIESLVDAAVADIETGSTQPRINYPAAVAYQFDLVSMADGTYKAVGRRGKEARFRPGAIPGGGIALQVFMDRVYGDFFVLSVGDPVVSGGSLTAESLGPRDTSAMVLIDGVATAGEERTLTFEVTMDTGGSGEIVPVTLDIKVFAE